MKANSNLKSNSLSSRRGRNEGQTGADEPGPPPRSHGPGRHRGNAEMDVRRDSRPVSTLRQLVERVIPSYKNGKTDEFFPGFQLTEPMACTLVASDNRWHSDAVAATMMGKPAHYQRETGCFSMSFKTKPVKMTSIPIEGYQQWSWIALSSVTWITLSRALFVGRHSRCLKGGIP